MHCLFCHYPLFLSIISIGGGLYSFHPNKYTIEPNIFTDRQNKKVYIASLWLSYTKQEPLEPQRLSQREQEPSKAAPRIRGPGTIPTCIT